MKQRLGFQRKFMVPTMPPLDVYRDYRTAPCSIIERHHLANEQDREEWVCKVGTRYIHITQDEFEQDIGPQLFQAFKRDAIASITKNRYQIRCGDWTLELDQYTGELAGLVIIEVEFKTEEDAAAFILPDWATGAIEVTTNEDYKNKNLALYGVPSTHLCTIQ